MISNNRYMEMTMYPKNMNEINNSCFIKLLTGGVMGIDVNSLNNV